MEANKDQSVQLLRQNAATAATILRVLANDRRLMVLCELVQAGERSVSELERACGISQSALSQHLAKMRQHGVVKTRRSAQTVFYSVASADVMALLDTLCRLYGKPHEEPAAHRRRVGE